MNIWTPFCVAICGAALTSPSALASPSAGEPKWTGKCASLGGYIEGPLVGDKQTARKIYIAIRNNIAPAYRNIRPDIVQVDDKGGFWQAYQKVRAPSEGGRVDVMGGGGIWLDIDKCSGAVLRAGRSR